MIVQIIPAAVYGGGVLTESAPHKMLGWIIRQSNDEVGFVPIQVWVSILWNKLQLHLGIPGSKRRKIVSEKGIGFLPCSLGDADPGLMRLPGMSPFELQEVWMFIHPDLRSLVRVQVMLEFLQQRFRDHRERLLGVTATTSNSETPLTGDSHRYEPEESDIP